MRANSTYFLQQAGLATDQSFNMAIVGYGSGLLGVVAAWFIIPHVGRRTIYIWGLSGLALLFFVIGILGIPSATSSLSWGIGATLIVSSFVHNTSIGPVAYSLVSELPSALLKNKSVVIARLCYNISGIPIGIIVPYMINPTAWAWGAKAGFFWGGSCLLTLIFTYFCIPEPKDRTPAELDILFEEKVSARKFAQTRVDISRAGIGSELEA